MNCKNIDPLWRLVDPLTVQQAAALVAGFDPNSVRFDCDTAGWFENETGLTDSCGISRVQIAFSAITNAILAGTLKVKVVHDASPVDDAVEEAFADYCSIGEEATLESFAADDEIFAKGYFIKKKPNWAKTMIGVDEVRVLLKSKSVDRGFFFTGATDAPDYLDPDHPRYSAKLAAAVKVWQAMGDENLLRGKGAIPAMEQWLESRYRELGLVHEKDNDKNGTKAGNMNNTAIKEAAKVANWRTGGGATKTPI